MSEQEIHDICKKYNITNYSINPDESIDVDETVYLSGKGLKRVPLKFNKVDGGFYCNNNNLTSLEGFPKHVSGNINLGTNQLTSLENSPIELGQYLYCYKNPLKSLVGYNLSYDKLVCDNKEKLIRKTKLKIIEKL